MDGRTECWMISCFVVMQDGWMDGRMNAWLEWMVVRMDGWVDRCQNGRNDKFWMDRCMDVWMNGW